MQILKIPLILLAAALTLFSFAAVAPPSASGEIVILVNSSTNLNAAKLRIVGGKWKLDDAYTNWTTDVTLEAWNNEVPSEIAARKTLTLSFAQMKALYNAADPSAALQNSALAKAQLVKKP